MLMIFDEFMSTNANLVVCVLLSSSMMLRHKSEINIPYSRNFMRPKGVKTINEYKLFN